MTEKAMAFRTAALAAAAFSVVGSFAAGDGIRNGVHGYTPKRYVQPKEPEVRERLEWFKDQKLALMMHWGLYSIVGMKESWCLNDSGVKRFRSEISWTEDRDEFKRQYWGLIRSPVMLYPFAVVFTSPRTGTR